MEPDQSSFVINLEIWWKMNRRIFQDEVVFHAKTSWITHSRIAKEIVGAWKLDDKEGGQRTTERLEQLVGQMQLSVVLNSSADNFSHMKTFGYSKNFFSTQREMLPPLHINKFKLFMFDLPYRKKSKLHRRYVNLSGRCNLVYKLIKCSFQQMNLSFTCELRSKRHHMTNFINLGADQNTT